MSDNDTSANRNFDKPSKEIALQQIYVATGYSVPANKIKFGQADVLDQFPNVFTDENSFVPAVIDPTEDARFNGDNGFIYRRLDLGSDLPANPDINSVPISYPFQVHDALPLINSFLGTQLDETDLENDLFTEAPVTLRVKKGSLAWIGKRTVTPTNGSLYLITNPLIKGFFPWDGNDSGVGCYAGLSADRLTALINESAGTNYKEGIHFTYGAIGTMSVGAYNTRIRIIPIDPTYTAQDLYFNRLALPVLKDLPEGTLQTVAITQLPFNVHDILDKINTALGLNLLPAEVFNTVYRDERSSYPLQVRSGASLAWTPSVVEFSANLDAAHNVRLLEDGTIRLMEDGTPRMLENPVV